MLNLCAIHNSIYTLSWKALHLAKLGFPFIQVGSLLGDQVVNISPFMYLVYSRVIDLGIFFQCFRVYAIVHGKGCKCWWRLWVDLVVECCIFEAWFIMVYSRISLFFEIMREGILECQPGYFRSGELYVLSNFWFL